MVSSERLSQRRHGVRVIRSAVGVPPEYAAQIDPARDALRPAAEVTEGRPQIGGALADRDQSDRLVAQPAQPLSDDRRVRADGSARIDIDDLRLCAEPSRNV